MKETRTHARTEAGSHVAQGAFHLTTELEKTLNF